MRHQHHAHNTRRHVLDTVEVHAAFAVTKPDIRIGAADDGQRRLGDEFLPEGHRGRPLLDPARCEQGCRACAEACPTDAFPEPYVLDARRCISYLTIELPGPIPEELRPLIGNRVYGCDDCQLACPWNKFAQRAELPDFDVRNGLDRATLVELFAWSEGEFRSRHAGSAILRIGYERWLRNIAVALGNTRAPNGLRLFGGQERGQRHWQADRGGGRWRGTAPPVHSRSFKAMPWTRRCPWWRMPPASHGR